LGDIVEIARPSALGERANLLAEDLLIGVASRRNATFRQITVGVSHWALDWRQVEHVMKSVCSTA
jgi:hypothetical protein